MSSDSEIDNQGPVVLPALDDLKTWKVVKLKEWLELKSLKQSGNKDTLVNSVFRAMNQAVVHLVTMKHLVVQSLKYQILAY
jgi:hypothetical protein